MTQRLDLAAFQRAAVDHIVERLRDKRGSQRFLLADEVGLGKTIVARGVIDALAKRRRRPLKVIYVCSNTEIAEQNRGKLVENRGASVGRVTELALKRGASDGAQLFAFTPGTSLSSGTGTRWERQLMLHLLGSIWGRAVDRMSYRRFFRCAAGVEKWMRETGPLALSMQFDRKVRSAFKEDLREAVGNSSGILNALDDAVSTYDESAQQSRSTRNLLIGRFRELLQRVAIGSLSPDLVVLDEIQRFKDVLDDSTPQGRAASALLAKGVPVLILSATPYRLLTLEHEAESVGEHHKQFHETVRFLFGEDSRTPQRIQRDLEEFGKRLSQSPLTEQRDSALLHLKRQIEKALRKVICRTERNWYLLDQRHGIVEEGLAEPPLPGAPEMREFFEIHHALAGQRDGVGLVSEFWKSAPALLAFMDGEYALTKALKKGKVRIARGLVDRPDTPTLESRNLRLRRLVEQVLGSEERQPVLWTRPTYTYFADEVYGDSPTRKMLVFSGWRFVPKAVAVAVSQAAARRFPKAKAESRQPLRLGEKSSFHVFDVCFPSMALARLVNPRTLATHKGATAADLVRTTRDGVVAALAREGIEVSDTRDASLWQVVARLESRGGDSEAVRNALRHWRAPKHVARGPTEEHRDQVLEWMSDDRTRLRIGKADLDRLVHVVAASPAVSLVRALLSVYGEEEVRASHDVVMGLCFNELRAYWNRPLNQQAVREYRPRGTRPRRRGNTGRGYAGRVLRYALDHHLQAVLDEHVYLIRNASTCSDVERAAAHFRAIWSLGSGSGRTNIAEGRGPLVRIGHDKGAWPTHFALAFGEERAPANGPGVDREDRLRRSDVREAFNSPFWPFVLATTSVGQEGLDFHLHCRDVFHWNLPSNPVDLEQREGRINRRDCLAVRQSIAMDWPIERLRDGLDPPDRSLWAEVFARVANDHTTQRYKHGLYPHWLYECHQPADTVRVSRHVAFYSASRDQQTYTRLKRRLALYRLVFGQADQEQLLNSLEQRVDALDADARERAMRRLAGYMLNLSPFDASSAQRLAHTEANELLAEPGQEGLQRLLEDVRGLVVEQDTELRRARPVIQRLVSRVERAMQQGALAGRAARKAVWGLAYLRNPFDQYFDTHGDGGYDDDVAVLRRAMGE